MTAFGFRPGADAEESEPESLPAGAVVDLASGGGRRARGPDRRHRHGGRRRALGAGHRRPGRTGGARGGPGEGGRGEAVAGAPGQRLVGGEHLAIEYKQREPGAIVIDFTVVG